MIPNLDSVLAKILTCLRRELGDNLYSCCLYGSAVRGDAVEGISDINLLIILDESTLAAQQAVAQCLAEFPQVDPFVLARPGLERSVRAFETKFSSIKRNYRLLHGADVLAGLSADTNLEKFLCEQTLRNLRLRLVYSFITRKRHKTHDRFMLRNVTSIFVQLSAALRLNDVPVPNGFEARIGILEKEFKLDGQVLRDLTALKKTPHSLTDDEIIVWHGKIFAMLNLAIAWVEEKWPVAHL